MKQFSILFLCLISSAFSFGQIRTIGTGNDSIIFYSIVTDNDSSIYFIGNKGIHHLFVLKTNQQLDTFWTKTISTIQPGYFPNATYLDNSNEILISCDPNLLIKLNANGSLIYSKEISIPGISYFNIRSSLVKNDSILFTANYYDGSEMHSGIAVADTSGAIAEFHDLGIDYVGKISKFSGGYFVSGQSTILDSNYNVLSTLSFFDPAAYFSCYQGEEVVLNDSTIVGSVVVFGPVAHNADEIFKITQQGLQWVVKDDLNISGASFNITPVMAYPNGNIACLMSGEDLYISIIDSNGYPVVSNNINVQPDTYSGKIAAANLNNKIIFANGNLIGVADSTGATCSSFVEPMFQYNPISSGSSSTSTDSTYSLNWNIDPVVPDTSHSSIVFDITCIPLSINYPNNKNEIVFYPNPWTDYFRISGLSEMSDRIIITDLYGKIVFETEVKNDELIKIPDELSAGIYFIKSKGLIKPIRTIKL